jgi:fused signal recognition particle receptor
MFGFLKEKLNSWFGKSKKEAAGEVKKAKKQAKKELEKAKKTEKKLNDKIKKEEKKEKQAKKKEERLEKELEKEEKLLEKETELEKAEKEIKIIARDEEKVEKLEKEIKKEEKEIESAEEEIKEEEAKKGGFFARLKSFFSYSITDNNFEEIFSELETLLLESNIALEVVEKIKKDLKESLVGKEIKKEKLEEEIKTALANSIKEMLAEPENLAEKIKEHRKQSKEPYVILFFGINGAGKTTSIAKIAHLLQKNKISCVLAAGDTFRAASIEQLQIHADKLGVKIIKSDYGADPASVGFDAVKYARANSIDAVLIDTAGRMHTKENLLHEMEKISRVTKPNLKIFVAEAVAGNDATEQAKAFNEMIGIDGSILSKVDVDEKGGAIVSISYITKKPILYLGVGQNYDDIELFDKEKFIERLGL